MSTESKVKYSPEQIDAITSHNQKLIEVAERNEMANKAVHGFGDIAYLKNQANYWRNVASGLRWANGLARQMQETAATDGE